MNTYDKRNAEFEEPLSAKSSGRTGYKVEDWLKYYDIGGRAYLGLFSEPRYKKGTNGVSVPAINNYAQEYAADLCMNRYEDMGFTVKKLDCGGEWKLYLSGKMGDDVSQAQINRAGEVSILWSAAEYTEMGCACIVNTLERKGRVNAEYLLTHGGGDVAGKRCHFGRVYAKVVRSWSNGPVVI